jgi:hypothetical protein
LIAVFLLIFMANYLSALTGSSHQAKLCPDLPGVV